jgi:hypothetical protein
MWLVPRFVCALSERAGMKQSEQPARQALTEPIMCHVGWMSNGAHPNAMRRTDMTLDADAERGTVMHPNPYLMTKIAEHKQHDLARTRGARNWRSLFRSTAK